MINRKIADFLDMEVPEKEEEALPSVIVRPEQIVKVDNEALPDMLDIDKRTIEGEAQLEKIIKNGLTKMDELEAKFHELEPKYLNRFLEETNVNSQITLQAIQTKLDFQLKKKKQRMEEANFQKKGQKGEGGNTINNFFGSREDIIRAIEENEPQ